MTFHKMWLPFALAAFGATVLTPLVIGLACRVGALAWPRPDRWHQRPTALLGGMAIYAASVTATLITLSIAFPSGPAARFQLLGLWAAATLVFALGLVDDLRGLGPGAKLAGQMAAACLLVMSGIRFTGISLQWLAVPLTLFWVIGITNAVNLLDNMDGVVAGVGAVAALALAVSAAAAGHSEVVAVALCLVGSCCGFLLYNFHPARIFMGDCGSLYLGFVLSDLALAGPSRQSAHWTGAIIIPVAVLAIPILDTTLVTISRRLHGRPVSQGGRDHTTHRLAALGLSQPGVALCLYASSALLGAMGLVAAHLPPLAAVALTAILLLVLGLFGTFLGRIRVYHTDVGSVCCTVKPARGQIGADEPFSELG